jgi:hypothetical protein
VLPAIAKAPIAKYERDAVMACRMSRLQPMGRSAVAVAYGSLAANR